MPLPVKLPEGYVPVEGARAWGFARAADAGWAAGVLAAGRTLHAWSAGRAGRRELAGRGRTWAVPAPVPGAAAGWVVRHYHRGGWVAGMLHDRYLAVGEPRPVAELRAALEAARRGIPVPAVVAGAVYPAGAFYRADLVTEEVPGGADLAEILFGVPAEPAGAGSAYGGPAPGEPAALVEAGRLARRLAEAGVRHPDLNAKNVVLERWAGGVRAWLVDLDGCGFGAPTSGSGGALLRRLERSLRKLGTRAGRPLPPEAWAALRGGRAPSGGAP